MKKLHIYSVFLLLLVLALTSCEKNEPVETVGEIVFSFNGTFDDTPVLIEAGRNGYFLQTGYNQTANGLYSFIGTFNQLSCESECLGDLSISIYDDEATTAGASSNIERSLFLNTYPIYIGEAETVEQYTASFTAAPNGVGPYTYLWDFGDNSSSTEANPVHTYPIDPSITSYPVCVTINYGNGCSSELCSEVYLPNSNCNVNFTYSNDGSNFLRYFAQPEGRPPFRYNWNFSSGAEAQTEDVDYEYHNAIAVDVVELEVTDGNGCVSIVRKNIPVDGNAVDCATNFSYSTSTAVILPEDPIALESSSRISWTTPSGALWTAAAEQPTLSGVEIVELEEYLLNEQGEKTKRMGFRLRAMMQKGSRTALLEGKGFFAVAYP